MPTVESDIKKLNDLEIGNQGDGRPVSEFTLRRISRSINGLIDELPAVRSVRSSGTVTSPEVFLSGSSGLLSSFGVGNEVTIRSCKIKTLGGVIKVGLYVHQTTFVLLGAGAPSPDRFNSTMIHMVEGLGQTAGVAELRVKRDSTVLSEMRITETSWVSPGGVRAFDKPAAGTYTYKVSIKLLSGTAAWKCPPVKMFCYEVMD